MFGLVGEYNENQEVFMRSLGIRVEPSKVTFVVIDYTEQEADILNVEYIKIPAALDIPEQLKYIRNTVLDIIREYEISVAGIKVTEGNADINIARASIEGVIQEAFSSSSVEKYFTGRVVSISKRLRIHTDSFKAAIKSNSKFPKINNWHLCTNEKSKEAALVGYGALL